MADGQKGRKAKKKLYIYRYVCVYLHQAEDNLNDFALRFNNFATFDKHNLFHKIFLTNNNNEIIKADVQNMQDFHTSKH